MAFNNNIVIKSMSSNQSTLKLLCFRQGNTQYQTVTDPKMYNSICILVAIYKFIEVQHLKNSPQKNLAIHLRKNNNLAFAKETNNEPYFLESRFSTFFRNVVLETTYRPPQLWRRRFYLKEHKVFEDSFYSESKQILNKV